MASWPQMNPGSQNRNKTLPDSQADDSTTPFEMGLHFIPRVEPPLGPIHEGHVLETDTRELQLEPFH